jgi:hypothetical protein
MERERYSPGDDEDDPATAATASAAAAAAAAARMVAAARRGAAFRLLSGYARRHRRAHCRGGMLGSLLEGALGSRGGCVGEEGGWNATLQGYELAGRALVELCATLLGRCGRTPASTQDRVSASLLAFSSQAHPELEC